MELTKLLPKALKEKGQIRIFDAVKELTNPMSNLNGGTDAINAQEGVLHGQHPLTTNIPLAQPFTYINPTITSHLI